MKNRLTLFLYIISPLCFFACSKSSNNNTHINSPIDSVKLLTGWWMPVNYSVQGKLYFGADDFFYNDTIQKKKQYAGFWKLKNGIIKCSSTVGGATDLSFKISELSTGKLKLSITGVGVIQTFNKKTEAAITSPPIISIAGTGVKGSSGDGGLATTATITGGAGITADKNGNIYFAEVTGSIRKIAKADGIISTIPRTTYSFAVTTDKNAVVYYSDYYRVYRISPFDGYATAIAGKTASPGFDGDTPRPAAGAALNGVNGLAIANNGDVFINDSHNSRIRKISAATKLISTVAIIPANSLGNDKDAYGIALDAAGNIYFNNFRTVYMIPANTSNLVAIAGKSYTNPKDYKAGDGEPATQAMFKTLSDIAVSAKGDIFVADQADHTVRKIDGATKIISKIAGTGYPGNTNEGIHAIAYSLNAPIGLATNTTGDVVYIMDLSARIHKVPVN